MGRHSIYNDYEVETMRKTMTAFEIAQHYGVSENALRSWAARNHVSLRRLTDWEMQEEAAAGSTARQIAKMYNVTLKEVKSKAKRLGLQLKEKQKMKQIILNEQEIKVQEMADWTKCIDENFEPGDYFNSEIAWELINAVPPHRLGNGYFQLGEPHDHRPDSEGRMRPRYLTLVRVSAEPEVWQYRGNCFTDEYEEK